MADEVEFTTDGRRFRLTRTQVMRVLERVEPEPAHTHVVQVGGKWFPVKQAFAIVTGLDLQDFISTAARRQFKKLGFPLKRLK